MQAANFLESCRLGRAAYCFPRSQMEAVQLMNLRFGFRCLATTAWAFATARSGPKQLSVVGGHLYLIKAAARTPLSQHGRSYAAGSCWSQLPGCIVREGKDDDDDVDDWDWYANEASGVPVSQMVSIRPDFAQ